VDGHVPVGKYGAQYDYRCPECGQVVHPGSWMALSALDLSNLGPMLGERKRLPVPATMERIRQALRKYWWAPPVLLPSSAAATAATVSTAHGASVSLAMSHSEPRYAMNRSRGLGEQLPTITQRNAEAVASLAGVLPLRSGRPRAGAVSDALATFVADGGRQALLLALKNNGAADEAGYRGHHLGGPLGALTSHPAQSVVAADGATIEGVGAGGGASGRQGHLFDADLASLTIPVLRGDHPEDRSVGEATATFAAAGTHQALATATFCKLNGGPGDTAWHQLDEPFNTFTSRDTHGLVLLPWVDQWRSDPALITEQLATVTTRLRHALASIEPYEGPITDEVMMRVRLRMLEPDPEIRRGMAFPDGYLLLGNKGQVTAGLGNAVTPPVANWITGRCLDTLRGGERSGSAA
jgi:DNA (cytosine-5)-methyltransferase 1